MWGNGLRMFVSGIIYIWSFFFQVHENIKEPVNHLKKVFDLK